MFPETIIYKRNNMDFLGVKLEYINRKKNAINVAYYGYFHGDESMVHIVYDFDLKSIDEGTHKTFFKNIDDLHSHVLATTKQIRTTIAFYKKTGKYWSK